uniref:Uncharacterized protein At2g33490 isoform X2 n=1 Tax=Elaeis guineensis var. tenera TaxID=51953 RepID=A0A8N4IA11_ELAGV|nr:uncharacterized protein At2g33490 isoform X2 [Elaeis guineensis]XP_029122276.1 uncharacterized protein At2g33490 isoform X2 [Elaeis guineensis]
MKSPLRKFRGFTVHRHDAKEKRDHRHPLEKLDDLVEAAQDMQDVRSCYDSLLSAAAATANGAYEFSEALQEMGTCLLEKTALNDDEDSGRVLLMLGKAQFALQKLVDSYRTHIIQTIQKPSESLLKELQTVEEMKCQCDDKRYKPAAIFCLFFFFFEVIFFWDIFFREIYKLMLEAHQAKGRSRRAKGETYLTQQLLAARDDYVEEAALFAFRLKSLKQGQSRSLLTQAARHHAAQLNFFRKGLKSLELVEPHVKEVAEQQHIDYHFSGLDDETDNNGDDYSGYDSSDDGELSFDYGQNDQYQDDVFASRCSLEENLDKNQNDFFTFSRRPGAGSQSAPIFADKKFGPSDKMKETQPLSTRKFHSYVLPTPCEAKDSDSMGPVNKFSADHPESKGVRPTQLWHSSPLVANKLVKDPRDNELSNPSRVKKVQSVLKESNINSGPIRMPSPSAEGIPWLQCDPCSVSNTKNIERQFFSGPLPGKAWSSKVMFSGTDYRSSMDYSPIFSEKSARIPTKRPMMSSKVSPGTSPPPISSAKITELHELPRPPTNLANPARPSTLIGYSGPLISRSRVLAATSRMPSNASPTASPLPAPPGPMARSFSIPSGGHRKPVLPVAKLLEAPHNPDLSEEVASPPLTPISLTIVHPASEATKSDS